jgi:large repetitive protein
VGSDSAAFTFYSSDEGSVFECSLDGTPYAAGASPESCANLSNGAPTFEVRAEDGAGNTDATPASSTWTVQR